MESRILNGKITKLLFSVLMAVAMVLILCSLPQITQIGYAGEVTTSHVHDSWTYTVGQGEDENKMTATCGSSTGEDCDLDNKTVSLILSAASQTYSGSAQGIDIANCTGYSAWKAAIGEPEVVYYTDSDCAEEHKTTVAGHGASTDGEAPVNVGSYWAAVTYTNLDSETVTAKVAFDITDVLPILYVSANVENTSYTVAFDTKGGTAVSEMVVSQNETLQQLPKTSKSGYTFEGWYCDEAYTTLFTTNTEVTKDTTVYAKWMGVLSGVTIAEPTKTTLTEKGETLQLVATVTSQDAMDKVISWESSDAKVATVDKTGKITAVGNGKVTITVMTTSRKVASIELTVGIVSEAVSKINFRTCSTYTEKDNVAVRIVMDTESENQIQQLKDFGYTVKFKYYRSLDSKNGFKQRIEKEGTTYFNTVGEQNDIYYYRAKLCVYDQQGKLVQSTKLSQCMYASRMWEKVV